MCHVKWMAATALTIKKSVVGGVKSEAEIHYRSVFEPSHVSPSARLEPILSTDRFKPSALLRYACNKRINGRLTLKCG